MRCEDMQIYESKFDSVEQACFVVVFGLVWCDMILLGIIAPRSAKLTPGC